MGGRGRVVAATLALVAGVALWLAGHPALEAEAAAPAFAAARPTAAAALPVAATAADVLVTDPERLAELAGPLAFGAAVFGAAATDLAALQAKSAAWRDLAAVVDTDVAAVKRADPTAGVGMRYSHRLFDTGWLRSPAARMELVGVAQRLDRQPLAPGHCGELRAIYRLAYTVQAGGAAQSSRLPMTVNAVRYLDGDCAALARERLHNGVPAAVQRWAALTVRAVEVNVQTVRWPSTVRPDLGGHAEYALRVLTPAGEHLQAAPMENQPDIARVAGDPVLRALLSAWLRLPATPAAIEAGIALTPRELWTTAAISYAPRGLMRGPNRPWQALLTADDVLALGGGDRQRGLGLLRRLDQHSCTGCHHSKSIAGFHLPGATGSAGHYTVGRMAVAASPHLLADMARRQAFALALAQGATPTVARPPPEAPRVPIAAGQGDHCGLQLEAGWRCGAGLVCTQVDDPEIGVCLPAVAAIGDPCQPGLVARGRTPGAETVLKTSARDCGSGYCESARVGFPAGLCAAGCEVDAGGEFPCAGIPGIVPFNACLARGGAFDACAASALRPARLRACDTARPCRDDYACMAAGPALAVCMPPYFLLELRMDGHPKPGR